MELSELKLYECTPDIFFGRDKDGNEYGINREGKLNPVKKGTIEPHWYHAEVSQVEQYIEGRKSAAAGMVNKNRG